MTAVLKWVTIRCGLHLYAEFATIDKINCRIVINQYSIVILDVSQILAQMRKSVIKNRVEIVFAQMLCFSSVKKIEWQHL